MQKIDGFRTTDSFRFDCQRSASSISLASSSGYGSGLSLSPTDHPSAHRRFGIKRFFKEKLSRHKSFASLLSTADKSSKMDIRPLPHAEIYDNIWNLEEQIEKLRVQLEQQPAAVDAQSIISMSVDTPTLKHHRTAEHDLLAAAAWYQEGLPRCICEEHLMLNQEQSIGSFLLRRSYVDETYPFVLSVRTHETSVEHFFIERTTTDCYRIKDSSKVFSNLSTLVVHHTVRSENLPVQLILPPAMASFGVVRSVRF